MDIRAVLKPLILIIFSVGSSADKHSLQYLYTVIASEVKSPPVVLLNGEQFVFYDGDIRQMIPKKEFVKKVEADEPQFWNSETQHAAAQQEKLVAVMKDFSDTEGIHIIQRMYGCDDGTTRRYDEFGYDGEDFFSLDLKTGTWTAVNPQAESFIKKWDPTGDQAKYWKNYLESNCIDWLRKVVVYGRETLERKVRPEASLFQKHSSSPEVVCHATGFFPKSVMITWQKDGRDVYEDVELRETLPNQDGSFQKRSILKVPAEDLQKHNYTCVIRHSSSGEELVLPVSERRILRGGGSDGGLTVLIVLIGVAVVFAVFVAGFIAWKKKMGSRSSDDGCSY